MIGTYEIIASPPALLAVPATDAVIRPRANSETTPSRSVTRKASGCFGIGTS
jgi:hypothetical protein